MKKMEKTILENINENKTKIIPDRSSSLSTSWCAPNHLVQMDPQ
jgi:hypothetical protein